MTLYSYNRKYKKFARILRKEQTEAESRLWSFLRGRKMHGYKFRRQQPISGFIIDFYCEEKKLAIELDGGQHLERIHKRKDQERDEFLGKIGIRTLRFLDNDIFINIDGVLSEIEKALYDLTPTLSSKERE